MALIGIVLALIVSNTTLSVMSFMGILMFVGTEVNFAIVMIDYINQLRKKGIEMEEAIVEGATTRLRPIIISAMTTILALIPLTLASGEGSELFSPIAITMLGGLSAGVILTLFVMPAFYSFMNCLGKKRSLISV